MGKDSFANEEQIKPITSALSYSSKWNMWLLNTGISPSWGPLYKDATFVTQLRSWLKTILETDGISQNGTIESSSSALTFLDQNNQNLLPGLPYRIWRRAKASFFHQSTSTRSQFIATTR